MFVEASKIIREVLLVAGSLGFIIWALWPESKPMPSLLPSPCPSKTGAVYTTIEVCDLKHPLCFSNSTVLNATPWHNKDLENHLSQDVLAAREEQLSSRLRLRQTEAVVHMEILTCMSKPGPVDSYKMATKAQQVLGGGAMRWSAEAVLAETEDEDSQLIDRSRSSSTGNILDEDLQLYFTSMSNLSEHKELIISTQSNFSHADIWRIGDGTRLILDNVIMSDSRDEVVYHEMLVHPALLLAAHPQRVLIIGGGEGATLREVLRDKRVEHVTMVDIDEGLVRICKEHLPMMHQGSFDSPKATVLFEDGAMFVKAAPSDSFDVIIVDGIDINEDDSSNPGNVLFEEPFYNHVLRTLRSGGMLVQYMSDENKEEMTETLLEIGFTDAQYLCVDIDSFLGAGACFMLSSNAVGDSLRSRLKLLGTNLTKASPEERWSYLTPESLSRCVGTNKRRLKSSGGGRGGGGRGGRHHSHNDHHGGGHRPQLLTANLLLFMAFLSSF